MKIKPFFKFTLTKIYPGQRPIFVNNGFSKCLMIDRNKNVCEAKLYNKEFWLDSFEIVQDFYILKKDILFYKDDVWKSVQRAHKLFTTQCHKIAYKLLKEVNEKECSLQCLVLIEPELFQSQNFRDGKHENTIFANYSMCALIK